MSTGKQRKPDRIEPCPRCGDEIEVYGMFRRWCRSCEWNLSTDQAPFKSSMDRAYERLGKAHGEHLFRSISSLSPEQLRPGWSVLRILATVLSVLVFAVSAALIGLAIWMVYWAFTNSAYFLLAFGVAILWIAWFARPRFGEPSEGLHREDFPALYALFDRIADRLGTARPDTIIVDEDFNAFYWHGGVPRRTTVGIGLPLWFTLSWPERVAIVAHEFAHGANGDASRGRLIGTAIATIEAWLTFFDTQYDEYSSISHIVGYYLLCLIAAPILLLRRAMLYLLWGQSQKAEYLADYLATTAAGTRPVETGLQKLGYAEHLELFANHSMVNPDQSGAELFGKYRDYFADLPESERERLNRVAMKESAQLDATHPPTIYRIEFIKSHMVSTPTVVVGQQEAELIDTEISQLEKPVGQALLKAWLPE